MTVAVEADHDLRSCFQFVHDLELTEVDPKTAFIDSEVTMPEDDQLEQPDNNADEQPEAGPPADSSAAEARLKELQTQFQNKEKELADSIEARDAEVSTKKNQLEALKGAVDQQTVLVDEIKKSSTAFGKGLEALQQAAKDLTEYREQKAKMIDAALGETKPAVKAAIVEVETKIGTQRQNVEKAAKDAATAGQEADTTQKELEKKQEAFNTYKQLQSELAGNVQRMKEFRSKVEENDDPPRPASMYVYIRELKTVLDVTKVPSQVDFDKKLNEFWKALDTAKENDRNKKLAWEAAKKKLAAEQATLVGLVNSQIADKLKATSEFN